MPSRRHARTKIQSQRTEHERNAARHIFATVLPNAFDNRQRTAVTHRKPFTRAPSNIKLPRCRAIQNRVAREHIAAPRSRRTRRQRDRAARQSLADVVVRFAVQFQRDTISEKRAELCPAAPSNA